MRRLGLLVVGAVAAGCTLVVGSLHECTANSDCASKGTGLVCQSNLCITAPYVDAGYMDPLCTTVLGEPDAGNTVLIGAILPFHVGANLPDGGLAPADGRGQVRQDAIQLAIDGVNEGGGVASHYLWVRVCDDQGTAKVAETEGAELAAMGAVAIITPGSGETIAAGSGANPLGVPVISGSATSSVLTSAGLQSDGGPKLLWSTAPSDNLQALVLTTLLLTLKPGNLPISHPGAVYRNDSYGQPLSNTLGTDLSLESDGGVTLRQFSFNPNDTGIPAAAQTAASAGPFDAVVVIGTPLEADEIISSWSGPTPYWLFSDNAESPALLTGLDGGFAELVGAEGTGPATAGEGTSVYQDFSGAFQEQWMYDPSTQGYLPNNYDAAMLIVAGIAYGSSHGGITGQNVARAFGLVSSADAGQVPLEPTHLAEIASDLTNGIPLNIQGASGDLDFDPGTGIAPGPIQIWGVDPDGGIGNIGKPYIPGPP